MQRMCVIIVAPFSILDGRRHKYIRFVIVWWFDSKKKENFCKKKNINIFINSLFAIANHQCKSEREIKLKMWTIQNLERKWKIDSFRTKKMMASRKFAYNYCDDTATRTIAFTFCHLQFGYCAASIPMWISLCMPKVLWHTKIFFIYLFIIQDVQWTRCVHNSSTYTHKRYLDVYLHIYTHVQ